MPTWLGFLWTSPNTLLGVLVGVFTFRKPRIAHGLLLFDGGPRGVTAVMRRANRLAMTIGFVVVSSVPVEGRLLAHERWHVRQYMRWGPLFIPVYLALAVIYGYRRHPMERSAERAAAQYVSPEGVGSGDTAASS